MVAKENMKKTASRVAAIAVCALLCAVSLGSLGCAAGETTVEKPESGSPATDEPSGDEGSAESGRDSQRVSADGLVDALDRSVSYAVDREVYHNVTVDTSSGYLTERDGLNFHVEYPQIKGLSEEKEAVVNEAVRDRAMLWVDKMYLDPSGDVQKFLRNHNATEGKYLGSQVESFITRNDEHSMSIAFVDNYMIGSVYSEYRDLRTLNVNLDTGERWHFTNEIVKATPELAALWLERSREQRGSTALHERVPLDDVVAILQNDDRIANRYFSDFFVDADGNICIAVSYHVGDDVGIARGFTWASFSREELEPYRVESPFWSM